MTVWIVFALITLAVAGILLFFLLRRQTAAAQRVDYDVVVYRDQLAEVDKDIERGLLTPEQADAARAEIYRRMLIAEDAENTVSAAGAANDGSLRGKLAPALFILIFLPFGAGLTYLYLGSPDLPGQPYAERQNDPEFIMATAAQRLAAQLQDKPDPEGYKRLGDIYFAIRFYGRAAAAYQKVIEMNGGSAVLWSEFGEAIALANNDLIVPDARAAFVQTLRLNPHDARARYYLGLAETQVNRPRRAVAIWKDLEKDSAPGSPWIAMLQQRIAVLAREGGFDSSSILPAPPALDATPSADAAAIMAMSPEGQNAMIHKMVDRLAASMKENPNDMDGWLRLANAYRVLGETGKAAEAQSKADALKMKEPGGVGAK